MDGKQNQGRFTWQLLCCAILLTLAHVPSHADPASTVAVMRQAGIISSTALSNHVASVKAGPNYNAGSFQSQQDLCGTVLKWFQQQDASIQSFALYDPSGGVLIATYSAAGLVATNH
jgi:hypothetical protein